MFYGSCGKYGSFFILILLFLARWGACGVCLGSRAWRACLAFWVRFWAGSKGLLSRFVVLAVGELVDCVGIGGLPSGFGFGRSGGLIVVVLWLFWELWIIFCLGVALFGPWGALWAGVWFWAWSRGVSYPCFMVLCSMFYGSFFTQIKGSACARLTFRSLYCW